MKSNKKKLIAVLVSVAVVLVALVTVLIVVTVRNNRPPDLETVRARFEEALSASGEINEILWGKGLDTYSRIYSESFSVKVYYPYVDSETGDSKTAEKTLSGFTIDDQTHGKVVVYSYYKYFKEPGLDSYIYYDFEKNAILSETPDSYYRYAVRTEAPRDGETPIYTDSEKGYYYYALTDFDINDVFIYTEEDELYYDYVRLDCGYLSVSEIKEAAAKVYSSDYLNAVYESIFTGITVSDADNGTLHPRYMDYESTTDGSSALVKYNQGKSYDLTEWVYDFSTMRMVDESNATFVTVEVERYPAGNEGAREVSTQYFALENGQWYLDSPSF
ncbi:MAG: hypothetical protein IJX39_09155 [Clostridia bacterium]|nr:hypothetical protein [Clostridia bacterium]